MARNKYPEETVERILDAATELFLEKGYENTTIQDIINRLGDLSKGAIYHHFKSKEDIIIAVINRLYGTVYPVYHEIKSSKELNGLEKLKKLFLFSVGNTSQEILVQTLPNLLKNPKFLAIQLDKTVNELAPEFIEPIILDGINDGSIQTEYPKELAEVMTMLANIWLNPFIFNCTKEQIYKKCLFFKHLMTKLNVDIFDDELLAKLEQLGNM
ncbi:MAG: TetR/AcrR family transcriptional regulator [Lachnospiraceae bacterium]|nr:TetR/AcrR family transcriptional regulator [Lachnospiraceae bacterium]